MARTVMLLHGSAAGYGADRQLLAIATGLDGDRYRPIVVLPEPGRLGRPLEEAGVETHYVELATLRRSLMTGRGAAIAAARLARNRVRLARLAKSRGVAVVHSNTGIVLGGQGVASAAGAAHLLHIREIFDGPHLSARRLWPLLRRRLLRADALICVSQATADPFGDSPKVRVIRDGLPEMPDVIDRTAARKALRLPADAPVVATVGRVSDWKGQHVLAEALALEPLASTGAIGVVAGDSAPGQERFERRLIELRQRLGLGDRLRLLGFREDVATVLGAADVFAAPSIYPDPFPNSALEASAAALPVVGSIDGGGLSEIIRDGVTGSLVPADDAHALGAALAKLVRDPNRAQSMGSAAAECVSDRFRLERMLAAVQACYDEVG
jgi:glycosyltransferase involved in cell wall biosynthesis